MPYAIYREGDAAPYEQSAPVKTHDRSKSHPSGIILLWGIAAGAAALGIVGTVTYLNRPMQTTSGRYPITTSVPVPK